MNHFLNPTVEQQDTTQTRKQWTAENTDGPTTFPFPQGPPQTTAY